MLNFGPFGIPLAFCIFGAAVGRLTRLSTRLGLRPLENVL
jgi:hypothetical protein